MAIAWLRPELLWALAALAVPIVLHLLNRRRTVRLDFSTLRFFEATAVRASRARTLRRLLQLLARIGIVVCLALLFAGPHNPGNPFAVLGDPQVSVYVWVDPTVSMRYREDGRSREEHAWTLVDSLQEHLLSGAVVRVWDESQGQFSERAGAGEAAATRHGPMRFEAVRAAVAQQVRRAAGSSVLMAFSDMQLSAGAVLDSAVAGWPAACPLLLVDMAPLGLHNSGICQARVSAENNAVLEVVVVRQGAGPFPAYAQVLLGGMRAGRATIGKPDSDTARLLVELPRQASAAWGVVALEEADGLSLDDSLVFLRNDHGGRTALIVGQDPAVFPLSTALRAAGEGYWEQVVVRKPATVSTEDIESASVIVLDQVLSPSAALGSLLSGRARRSAAVVLSPSTAAAAQGFNSMVLRRISASAQVSVRDSGASAPVLTDTLSPLWRGFPALRERTATVSRYLRGIPGEPLLRLDNGDILAARATDSSGIVWVLCATPLGITEDNNLCETGFYVPLLDRITRYAAAAASASGETWYAGSPRPNPYFGRQGSAEVFSADGELVAKWATQPVVTLEQPGAYRVAPVMEPAGWLRVVADPAELDLRYRSLHPDAGPAVAVVAARGFADFVRRAGESRLAAVLWIALAALVLLEMLLWPRAIAARG